MFIFSLKNYNEEFLKFALNETIFDACIFEKDAVKELIIEMLKKKARSEFIFNVLLYADLTLWSQTDLN